MRISDDNDKKKYRKWIVDNKGKLTDKNLMLLVEYLEACWAVEEKYGRPLGPSDVSARGP